MSLRQTVSLPSLIIFLTMSFLAAFMTACKSADSTQASFLSASKEGTSVSGTLVSEGLPIKHATIFIKGMSGQNNSEVVTRPNGTFDIDLIPGRYHLSSQPTGYCPVSGDIVLPNSPEQPIPLRIELSRLSFYHCSPGTILLSGKALDQAGRNVRTQALLSGIIDGMASKDGAVQQRTSTSFFLTAEGPGEKTAEIPLDSTGRFIAPPLVPGRYILDLALSGFCPVHQTLDIPPGAAYLQMTLAPHKTGTPCANTQARIILPGS